MKKIGSISHELYDSDKLNLIHKRIENASAHGEKQDYEILIDGIKIVPRNADSEKFDSFAEFITSDSECLTLYLYLGASKHSDTYFFYFKQVPVSKLKPQGLSGNLEDWEKQQKDKVLKELHYESLEKENEELKAGMEELQNTFKAQEEHWGKMKEGQLNSYSEIGSAILVNLLYSPQIRKMFPALNAFGDLGGHPEGGKQEDTNQGNTKQEEGATFRRKEEKKETEGNKTDETAQNDENTEEQDYVELFRSIQERFDQNQLEYLKNILVLLVDNPVALKFANKQLQNFLNDKPKT